MTLLDEKVLDAEIGIVARVYQAPIHESTSPQRFRWKYEGVPFFEGDITNYWDLRESSKADGAGVILGYGDEYNQRMRFIKRSIIIAVNTVGSDSNVVGGIWIDSVVSTQDRDSRALEKQANFHISVEGDNRKAADPLLSYFVDRSKTKFDSLKCLWGERLPENNPTQFFKRNGFEVYRENGKMYALLRL
jgi:hypothetical protein